MIPLSEIHIIQTRLRFSNILSNKLQAKLCIQCKLDMVLNRFKEVNIIGEMDIKQKLLEIVCLDMTYMIPLMHKVKTKGS